MPRKDFLIKKYSDLCELGVSVVKPGIGNPQVWLFQLCDSVARRAKIEDFGR
jgi:hypothetical protein